MNVRGVFVLSSPWPNHHHRGRCVMWTHWIPQLDNWQGQCLMYPTSRTGAQYIYVNWLTEIPPGFHVFIDSQPLFQWSCFFMQLFSPSTCSGRSKRHWLSCIVLAFSWDNSLEVKNVSVCQVCRGWAPFWFAWDWPDLSPLQVKY